MLEVVGAPTAFSRKTLDRFNANCSEVYIRALSDNVYDPPEVLETTGIESEIFKEARSFLRRRLQSFADTAYRYNWLNEDLKDWLVCKFINGNQQRYDSGFASPLHRSVYLSSQSQRDSKICKESKVAIAVHELAHAMAFLRLQWVPQVDKTSHADNSDHLLLPDRTCLVPLRAGWIHFSSKRQHTYKGQSFPRFQVFEEVAASFHEIAYLKSKFWIDRVSPGGYLTVSLPNPIAYEKLCRAIMTIAGPPYSNDYESLLRTAKLAIDGLSEEEKTKKIFNDVSTREKLGKLIGRLYDRLGITPSPSLNMKELPVPTTSTTAIKLLTTARTERSTVYATMMGAFYSLAKEIFPTIPQAEAWGYFGSLVCAVQAGASPAIVLKPLKAAFGKEAVDFLSRLKVDYTIDKKGSAQPGLYALYLTLFANCSTILNPERRRIARQLTMEAFWEYERGWVGSREI